MAPSHYLNQCCNIDSWTLGNKFQWNHNRNSYIQIEENAFENVVCENRGNFVRASMSKKQTWKALFSKSQNAATIRKDKHYKYIFMNSDCGILCNFAMVALYKIWCFNSLCCNENSSHYFALPKCHDDVIKWKHFPCYWPFVRGILRWPVNSPHKANDSGLWCFLWSE